MDISEILSFSTLLFLIIYTSVRLAIRPLLNKQVEIIPKDNDLGLIKLRI